MNIKDTNIIIDKAWDYIVKNVPYSTTLPDGTIVLCGGITEKDFRKAMSENIE